MTATTAAPAIPALQQKFHDTDTSMRARLLERPVVVRTACLALASRTHVFYEGIPGVAKSYMVSTLIDHIEGLQPGDYFRRQINGFMTDANVFGPPDMLAMEQGIYRQVVDRTLVTAKIAFLDELWKGNGTMQDSLLMATNERIFENGWDTIEMPLWSLYCASNEFPTDEHEAIADRIHFWHIVARIKESSSFIAMLKTHLLPPTVPTLSVDDIEQAHKEVSGIAILQEVYEALDGLRLSLAEEGVEPTDRRFFQCLPVIQATAWWRGSDEADVDDMKNIRHILWRRPDHIPIVDTQVLQLSSPLEAEAMEMRATIAELCDQVHQVLTDSDNPQQRHRLAIELHGKLDQFADEVINLEDRLAAGGRRSEITDELRDQVVSATDRLLSGAFSIDPTQIRR